MISMSVPTSLSDTEPEMHVVSLKSTLHNCFQSMQKVVQKEKLRFEIAIQIIFMDLYI